MDLPPITISSPNGTHANVTKIGNTERNGATKCSNRSAPSGTKSSFVNIFTGSAMSVFTIPVFHGSTPKIDARFAPIRFWMSAEPLRSTHSRKTVRCSTISNTTSALIAAMPISSPIRFLPRSVGDSSLSRSPGARSAPACSARSGLRESPRSPASSAPCRTRRDTRPRRARTCRPQWSRRDPPSAAPG